MQRFCLIRHWTSTNRYGARREQRVTRREDVDYVRERLFASTLFDFRAAAQMKEGISKSGRRDGVPWEEKPRPCQPSWYTGLKLHLILKVHGRGEGWKAILAGLSVVFRHGA